MLYDGDKLRRAADITDPHPRGILVSARATNRVERAWLTDMLDNTDPEATR